MGELLLQTYGGYFNVDCAVVRAGTGVTIVPSLLAREENVFVAVRSAGMESKEDSESPEKCARNSRSNDILRITLRLLNLGDGCAIALGKELKKYPKLRVVDLSLNRFTVSGFQSLIRSWKPTRPVDIRCDLLMTPGNLLEMKKGLPENITLIPTAERRKREDGVASSSSVGDEKEGDCMMHSFTSVSHCI